MCQLMLNLAILLTVWGGRPVSPEPPTNETATSLMLHWSQTESAAPVFAVYELYQSATPGELGERVAVIPVRSQTMFVVTALEPQTAYYYTLRTVDVLGQYADSAQVDGGLFGDGSLDSSWRAFCTFAG